MGCVPSSHVMLWLSENTSNRVGANKEESLLEARPLFVCAVLVLARVRNVHGSI